MVGEGDPQGNVPETDTSLEEICCHSISSKRPSAKADVKNSIE